MCVSIALGLVFQVVSHPYSNGQGPIWTLRAWRAVQPKHVAFVQDEFLDFVRKAHYVKRDAHGHETIGVSLQMWAWPWHGGHHPSGVNLSKMDFPKN